VEQWEGNWELLEYWRGNEESEYKLKLKEDWNFQSNLNHMVLKVKLRGLNSLIVTFHCIDYIDIYVGSDVYNEPHFAITKVNVA